jgi:hypothetical protein
MKLLLVLAALVYPVVAQAVVTSIKDQNSPYYAAVHGDGTLDVNIMSGGMTCNPGMYSVVAPLAFNGSNQLYVPVMQGDAGAGGVSGLCPAPGVGDATKFLGGDALYHTAGSQWTVSGSDIYYSTGHVGVGGAPNTGAALDVTATNGGLGIPVLTTTQRNLVAPARDGVIIWNSDNGRYEVYKAGNWTAPFPGAYGNLTAAGTDGITVTNGSGSVIGSGTSVQQQAADATHNGYFTTTLYSTFSGKQDALSDAANIAYKDVANTFTVAGAASAPAMKLSGAAYTGGSTTTAKALFEIEDAATSTAWNASGTEIGVNAVSTMHGDLMNLMSNNVPVFEVGYNGAVVLRNVGDNLGQNLVLCGQTGTPGSSNNCLDLYMGNNAVFGMRSRQSGFVPLQMGLSQGRVTLGGGALNHPSASVVIANPAGDTATPTLVTKLIASQTADHYEAYDNDEATIRFKITKDGGFQQHTTASQPTCSSTTRGMYWNIEGAAGVKDQVQVCAKDAADAYAWRAIY